MKKKIKDMTLQEVKKICHKKNCFYCPFYIVLCDDDFKIDFLDEVEDVLDEEIEVEDDE